MRDIIKPAFEGEINALFKDKPEIRKFIFNHERKELCINNLVKEIRLVELTMVKLDRGRIQGLARDFARTFARLTLQRHKETNLTALQKRDIRKEKEEFDFFESLFEEKDSSESLD